MRFDTFGIFSLELRKSQLYKNISTNSSDIVFRFDEVIIHRCFKYQQKKF